MRWPCEAAVTLHKMANLQFAQNSSAWPIIPSDEMRQFSDKMTAGNRNDKQPCMTGLRTPNDRGTESSQNKIGSKHNYDRSLTRNSSYTLEDLVLGFLNVPPRTAQWQSGRGGCWGWRGAVPNKERIASNAHNIDCTATNRTPSFSDL